MTHGRLRRSDDSGGPSYLRDTARSKAYTKASRAYAPLRRGTHANRKKRQPTVPKSPAFSKFYGRSRARENAREPQEAPTFLDGAQPTAGAATSRAHSRSTITVVSAPTMKRW